VGHFLTALLDLLAAAFADCELFFTALLAVAPLCLTALLAALPVFFTALAVARIGRRSKLP
jgi:hypothetical protein